MFHLFHQCFNNFCKCLCLFVISVFDCSTSTSSSVSFRSGDKSNLLPVIKCDGVNIRLQLHGTIYRPDSFVLMQRYCANLKAISYESTSLNRIVADESHRVIVAF